MARIRLDRVTIVRSALVVIEKHSLEKLTLAAVAEHLGVGSPALYNHLENLEELQHEVAVHSADALASRLRDAALGQSGDDAIASLAQAYRAFAMDNGAQFASMLRPPKREGDDLAGALARVGEVFERVVAVGYELADETAVDLARSTWGAVHGFVVLEVIEGAFGPAPDNENSFDQLVGTLLAGIEASIE